MLHKPREIAVQKAIKTGPVILLFLAPQRRSPCELKHQTAEVMCWQISYHLLPSFKLCSHPPPSTLQSPFPMHRWLLCGYTVSTDPIPIFRWTKHYPSKRRKPPLQFPSRQGSEWIRFRYHYPKYHRSIELSHPWIIIMTRKKVDPDKRRRVAQACDACKRSKLKVSRSFLHITICV